MIQYTCDICGAPMPEGYIRPRQPSGQLANACRARDVCTICTALGRQLDVSGILLAAWRAVPRPAADDPPAEEPPPLREHTVTRAVTTGRESAEKMAILERLRSYRKEHGLGCLADVAKLAGRGMTDDTLRGVLHGDVTLDITGWRQVGKALDHLAPKEASGE